MNTNNIEIDGIDIRARSYRYQDDEKYIDSTYYDKTYNYLDLGFQRLRYIDKQFYCKFINLRKLYIDHNNLTFLPDEIYLPNLTVLNCSCNKLKKIPFFPKLTFLNLSYNQVTSCSQYNDSNLTYLDCSYNPGLNVNFNLPLANHLYITNNELLAIDLNYLPALLYLDCSFNQLSNCVGYSETLVELNIQNNNITDLQVFENLKVLSAENNKLSQLLSYPKVKWINVSFNNIYQISAQPQLETLIAHDNAISFLGHVPELRLIDVANNKFSVLNFDGKIEFANLQFNPLNKLYIDTSNIKELQISYEIYPYIYEKYYKHINNIDANVSYERLQYMLKKMSSHFNADILKFISDNISNTKFSDRQNSLFDITSKLFNILCGKNYHNLEELSNDHNFQKIYANMTKLYYKVIVFTLHFNNYQ